MSMIIGKPFDWNKNIIPIDFSVGEAMWIDARGNAFTRADLRRAKSDILALYMPNGDYDPDGYSIEIAPVQQGVLRIRVIEDSVAGRIYD